MGVVGRTSHHAFFGVSALLFAASAALTIVWCTSMSAMGEMPMPGGWTMSMAWIPIQFERQALFASQAPTCGS